MELEQSLSLSDAVSASDCVRVRPIIHADAGRGGVLLLAMTGGNFDETHLFGSNALSQPNSSGFSRTNSLSSRLRRQNLGEL